jgi:hypothetical protein
MPSRKTSAFHRTVRVALHERASDYVMWVAGHGGTADTVNQYLNSVLVFPSHFDEWAGDKCRDLVIASIPALHFLMPGLTKGAANVPAVPLTPVIEQVVAIAIQQHIMAKDSNTNSVTEQYAPRLELLSQLVNPAAHISVLAACLGERKP